MATTGVCKSVCGDGKWQPAASDLTYARLVEIPSGAHGGRGLASRGSGGPVS